MLRNQEIVYIANDWVRDNKTSAHHIAEVLARSNRMLYVEGAGMRAPRASSRDFLKILRKLRGVFARPRRVNDHLYLFSPTLVPFHQYAIIRHLNGVLLNWQIRSAMRYVGFNDAITWVYMPHFAPALKYLPRKALVYYCVDDYASQPLTDPAVIRAMEREIVEQADVVFAVSEALVRDKSAVNPQTFLSPHGVDAELFEAANSAETPVPEDIAALPRPIAGYFGLIEEWVDLELIEHLARAMPDVTFVFIGRVVYDVSRFSKYKNVHFLGPRPYDSLAGYLKAFDAGLLLYRSGGFNDHANPKKLREYLAGGKAVVSVRNREVERYAAVVSIADTYDGYVQALRAALVNGGADKVRARQQAVAEESWEARVERLSGIIEDRIAERGER